MRGHASAHRRRAAPSLVRKVEEVARCIAALENRIAKLEEAARIAQQSATQRSRERLSVLLRAVGVHAFSVADLRRQARLDADLGALLGSRSPKAIGRLLLRLSTVTETDVRLCAIARDETGCIWQIQSQEASRQTISPVVE
jgi:hypothetical protein